MLVRRALRPSAQQPLAASLPSLPCAFSPSRLLSTIADPLPPRLPPALPLPRGLAAGRYQAPDSHPSRAIVGSAGKGATPNYGRRNRIRKPPPPHIEHAHAPGLRAMREQAEKEQGANYVHDVRAASPEILLLTLALALQYSPSTRTKRPLPQHTYCSPPSGVVSAAGFGGGLPSSGGGGQLRRKKTALIFAGQGAQYVGMAQKLYRTFGAAQKVWINAEEALCRPFDPAARPAALPDYASPAQRAAFEAALATTAYADPTRDQPSQHRGWLRDLVFDGDQLNLTRAENAWPAVFTATMTFLQVLREEFAVDLVQDHVQAAVGHGMGNLASLAASGALELTDGVRFLRHYGLASTMHLRTHPTFAPPGAPQPLSAYDTWGFVGRAHGTPSPLMCGVMLQPGRLHAALMEIEMAAADLRAGSVDGVGAHEYAEVANINSSHQIVLAGTRAAVRYMADRLRLCGHGAKAVNLPVSGPWFTSKMRGAADFVRPALSHLPLAPVPTPGATAEAAAGGGSDGHPWNLQVASPFTGQWLCGPDAARADLQGAVARPVRWLASVEALLDAGVERFICLGPGRACGHLLSKELAHRDRTARALAARGITTPTRASIPKPLHQHQQSDRQPAYEVWSVASTEDIVQLGSLLQSLSLTPSSPSPAASASASVAANMTPLNAPF